MKSAQANGHAKKKPPPPAAPARAAPPPAAPPAAGPAPAPAPVAGAAPFPSGAAGGRAGRKRGPYKTKGKLAAEAAAAAGAESPEEADPSPEELPAAPPEMVAELAEGIAALCHQLAHVTGEMVWATARNAQGEVVPLAASHVLSIAAPAARLLPVVATNPWVQLAVAVGIFAGPRLLVTVQNRKAKAAKLAKKGDHVGAEPPAPQENAA